MLSLDQIILSFQPRSRDKKEFCLKEYLQYKILQSIFSSQYANKLAFLGGTALRILHNNSRFSEDLDFDNFNLSFEEFNDLGAVIKADLELEGLLVEISTVKKWAFHCSVKMPEILYNNGLAPMKNTKILIQIDTVSQDFEYEVDRRIISQRDVTTPVLSCPIDLLLSQKLFACFTRKRLKWRDFFDIVFILGLTKSPNYAYLSQKMRIDNPTMLRSYLLDNCKWVDFEMLQADVAPFLFDPYNQSVKLFPQIIEQIQRS